jgi:hypothetical protein
MMLFIQVNYLKEFGLSSEDVGRLLAFKPQLMGCSIEERWKPLVKYLYYLGISRDGMKRMLVIKPMVFCVDLEQTIVPKVYNYPFFHAHLIQLSSFDSDFILLISFFSLC